MAIQARFPSNGTMDWVDIGCVGGEGFNNNNYYLQLSQQQLLLQQQQQQHYLRNQAVWSEKSNLLLSVVPPPQTLVSAFEEKQRQEIDQYIRMQNERLRMLLQEQRKQHLAMLLKRIELKTQPLLRQKDEEISQASKRNRELEDFLKKLEVESKEWQRLAQEKEAIAISLNNTIEQLKEKAFSFSSNPVVKDSESCCDQMEAEGENYFSKEVEESGGELMCKGCKCRKSCVLFLPCRHLSSCKTCEGFLDACPACQTIKKATIEALIG